MNTIHGKYDKTITRILFTAGILMLCYIAVKYLLPFLAPFVIAVIIALINEPIVRFLEDEVKIKRSIAAAISLLVTFSILGFLLFWGALKVYHELLNLQSNLPNYINDVSNYLNYYIDRFTAYYRSLPVAVTDAVDQNLKSFAPKLQDIMKSLATSLLSTITSIPKIALYTVTTLLAAYFISSDRRKIRVFLYKQFPGSWSRKFPSIRTGTSAAVFGYIRAQLLLIFITFIEVCTGLILIKSDYALLMGIIAAISDAIPVLGTGIVFIPWILWNLITGNTGMFYGLTIIYLIGVIVRQILEPKIVGSQIGLHPLATLAAMYAGLSLFGIPGMFLCPIGIIIIRNLQTAGVIKLWNE